MIKQKNYHQPYIPSGPKALPYVGGELEQLTSGTPFYRGQGVPTYPFSEQKLNFASYYGEIPVGLSSSVGLTYNDSTKELQQALIANGYSVGSSGADGKFGSDTTSALKKFQKSAGLPQTGSIDQATKDALMGKGGAVGEQPKKGGFALQNIFDAFEIGLKGYQQTYIDPTTGQPIYQPAPKENNTMKILIGVGGIALFGGLIYAFTRK